MISYSKIMLTLLVAGTVFTFVAAETTSEKKDVCTIVFEKDGAIVLDNSLISTTATPYAGQDYGFSKWLFKPTGFEMVDVLYGQTDYVKGHILGERWDPVEAGGVLSGTPFASKELYVPIATGSSKNGSLSYLVQEANGDYRWRRTTILRRDCAVLEIRYELENLTTATKGFALRFHSALNPGARGKYQRNDDLIFVPLQAAVLGLDQSLSMEKYFEKYLDDKFFLPIWDKEPARLWVRGKLKTSPLAGNWAAQVNQSNGDGMAFILDQDSLVGFYNCPGTTLEPVFQTTTLSKGKTWTTRCFVAAFSGAKNISIQNTNPIFITCQPLAINGGKLSGKIIPLFRGILRLLDAGGNELLSTRVDPLKPIDVALNISGTAWRMIALDTQDQEIGTIDSGGKFQLHEEEISLAVAQKNPVKTDVFIAPDSRDKIHNFLAARDFTVYCAWSDTEEIKAAAQKIAHTLGVGLAYKNPGGKLLVIGSIKDDLIRDIGLLKQSLSLNWPGAGKGATLVYDNLEFTQSPAILVGGSDTRGTLIAQAFFTEQFLKAENTPTGFSFKPADVEQRIYPYTRVASKAEKISIKAARGEYEPAQAVITANENLANIKVTVAPLLNATTGKPIATNYLTNYRKKRGPIWVRWVNNYPIDAKEGWTGYPDPLLERPETNIPADISQSLWLTFIIPQNAEPGLYTSSITCESDKGSQSIPIEVTVWDFNLPQEGLRGEPYIHFSMFPPSDDRELKPVHIERLVTNMVEHGMREIHLSASSSDLYQWHLSKEGKLQDMGLDYMTVNVDGTVALDAHGLDWLVNECDKVGKPFNLSYSLYLANLLGASSYRSYGDFKRAFPDRFNDMPKREGHFSQDYYAQEMISLLKKHLEKKGWLDRFVMKIADEPKGFDWWDARFTKAAREVGMPYYTCFNTIDWKDAEKGLGQLKLWQPLYCKYDAEFFKKAKASGAKIYYLYRWIGNQLRL